MPRDDEARIGHMIEAAKTLARFVERRGRRDLDSDQMLLFACTHAVLIIGEAASNLSEDRRDAYPTIPWPQIVAMRNRLVHAYFDIDHDVLWRTATEEVPMLLMQLTSRVPKP
jgi:uncharacterized protein with HEPN domain